MLPPSVPKRRVDDKEVKAVKAVKAVKVVKVVKGALRAAWIN
jgi:hypothetical protein